MNLLKDKVFTVEMESGLCKLSLPEVLFEITNNSIISFRYLINLHYAPVVFEFAKWISLCKKYKNCISIEDYYNALSSLGIENFNVFSDYNSRGYRQPVSKFEGEEVTFYSFAGAFDGVGHELKFIDPDNIEYWIFGLIGSQIKPYSNANPDGSLSKLLCVLPGDGKTISSEIMNLVFSYVNQTYFSYDTNIEDHVLWFNPFLKNSFSVDSLNLPLPFFDIGRCFYLKKTDYGIKAYSISSSKKFCNLPSGNFFHEPACPHLENKKGIERWCLASKNFSYSFISLALFGGKRKDDEFIYGPTIFETVKEFKSIRLICIGSDQGKTKGLYFLYENLPIKDKENKSSLFGGISFLKEGRVLSESLVSTLKDIEKFIYFYCINCFKNKISEDSSGNFGVSLFNSFIRYKILAFSLDVLSKKLDEVIIKEEVRKFCFKCVLEFKEELDKRVDLSIESEKANLIFFKSLFNYFNYESKNMSYNNLPKIYKEVSSILRKIDYSLNDSERSSLRNIHIKDENTLLHIKLSLVPEFYLSNSISLWIMSIRALSSKNNTSNKDIGISFGKALAQADISASRVDFFTSNRATIEIIEEVLFSFLQTFESKGLGKINLSLPLSLALSIKNKKYKDADLIRRQILQDYVKHLTN